VARPLGIIANTAPLLGLLGTVIGIVEAFDVVARQGALGDPSALADGIAKALLTTVFGLIVAIPTLMAYHYFVGRSEALLRRCEELAKEALVLPPE
jgi:biopolymer transport protein ExbB